MTVRFAASTVVIDDSDASFLVIGFANDSGSESLQFQRTLKRDEQDVALGLDGVYIERNDQQQGGYRGVGKVMLHRDHLLVEVVGEVAERMKAMAFEIEFSISNDEFQRLRMGLATVLTGSAEFVVHTE